jgi:hypothetical protein
MCAMRTRLLALLLLLALPALARAQVWVPDKGDGTYRNPIIHADYSINTKGYADFDLFRVE